MATFKKKTFQHKIIEIFLHLISKILYKYKIQNLKVIHV